LNQLCNLRAAPSWNLEPPSALETWSNDFIGWPVLPLETDRRRSKKRPFTVSVVRILDQFYKSSRYVADGLGSTSGVLSVGMVK